MKKGFLYLELLMTIGLLVILLLVLGNWYRLHTRSVNKLRNYYSDRELLLNKAAQGEGDSTPVTANIVLKTISINQLSLEYLDTKN